MSELPKGWAETDLGTIAAFVMGQAPPGTASNFDGVGTPFVKAGEFGEVRPVIREWTTMPLKMAEEGDVLICVVGATSGKINLGANCAIGRSVAAIRPSEAIDQFYLHSFMKTQVEGLRRGSTGTAQGVISSAMLSSVPVPLAPLPEQKRIVAKVDGLTARTARARNDLDRIPTLIARYKQRLLALAFSGELTAGWRAAQGKSLSSNLKAVRAARKADTRLSRRKRYAELPDFEIPESWDWISPDEVAADAKYSIGIGPFGSNLVRADYRESGVRLVFVRDIRRERFDEDDARFVDFEKAKELHQHVASPGDVLITKMGDPPGDSALFPNDAQPAIITADCIKLTPHADLIEARYLNYCIRSLQVQSQFKAITAGVAQQKVSLDRFRQLALPVAPLVEQAEIVSLIESAFNWLDRMAADHAAAIKLVPKLDAAILAKAFRGELVPQDPNDEPASMLLERIQAERAGTPKQVRLRKPRTLAPQEVAILPHSDTDFFEVIPRTPGAGASAMTKSRQDEDVMGKPYLANLLKAGHAASAQDLFRAADLPVADFYKQLAWEIANKHIRDDDEKLEAL